MFLYSHGIIIQEPCYDTIAAAQLVYKNEAEFRGLGDCGLKTLAAEFFNQPLLSYSDTVGSQSFDELNSTPKFVIPRRNSKPPYRNCPALLRFPLTRRSLYRMKK